jgi:predicted nicotinamide N-methyase
MDDAGRQTMSSSSSALSLQSLSVLDFGSGCGIEAIAAKLCGAKTVAVNDIDPFALTASLMNAKRNGVTMDTVIEENIIGKDVGKVSDWNLHTNK